MGKREAQLLQQGEWSHFACRLSCSVMSLLCNPMDEAWPFAEMWIDLQTVRQSEVSQKEKNQHHIVLFISEI